MCDAPPRYNQRLSSDSMDKNTEEDNVTLRNLLERIGLAQC